MNIPKTILDLEGLLYALAQQPESLPETLQHSMHKVGQSLQQNPPEAGRQLRQLIKEYPPLEASYKAVLAQWDAQYTSQERTKNLSLTHPNQLSLNSQSWLTVMSANNWVAAAKKQVAEANQFSQQEQWWQKFFRRFLPQRQELQHQHLAQASNVNDARDTDALLQVLPTHQTYPFPTFNLGIKEEYLNREKLYESDENLL